jgi:anti-anti-sigma factor
MSGYQLRYVLTRDSDRDPELVLTTLSVGPLTEVEVIGIVDYSSAHLLTSLVDRLIAAYSPRWLVLDLARVHLLGAAGVTALLRSRNGCGAQRGRLILRNPSPMTCKVLDITETAGQFDIRTTVVIAPDNASSGAPRPDP